MCWIRNRFHRQPGLTRVSLGIQSRIVTSLCNMNVINELAPLEFTKLFNNVVEYSPQIAESLLRERPFASVGDLVTAIGTTLDQLSNDDQLTVLRKHPDLAGRFESSNGLSAESLKEQTNVGLLKLEEEQIGTIRKLNDRYQARHEFPFIICVRLSNLELILDQLKVRLNNPNHVEVQNGIDQVKKIAELRIKDILASLRACKL